MNKIKKILILSVCMFFSVVIGMVALIFERNSFVFADNTAPSVEVISKTLSLDENIHIKFAVSTTNTIAGDEVGVLTFAKQQTEYTINNATKKINVSEETMSKNDVTYPVYNCGEYASKQMVDVLYARSYVLRNGVYYYGEVEKYSILEYAYNKLGKTDATPTSNQNLVNLLKAMLNYGGLAQTYFNYKTDTLASDNFIFVKIDGADFGGGFDYDLVRENKVVNVNLPENTDLTAYELVKEATCTEPAKYGYTIGGVTIYVETKSLGHNYTEYENKGDGAHYKICLNDSSHKVVEACTSSPDLACIYCGGNEIPSNGNSVYGYKSFANETNGIAMQDLYLDMYIDCVDFAKNSKDVVNTNDYYLLSTYDYTGYNLTIDECVSVWKVFYLENPQFYWLSNTLSFLATEMNLCVDQAYASASYRQECDLAVVDMISASEQLLSSDMSDLEIAKNIHDFIIGYMDYAYESDGTTPESEIWAHNMIGCAKNNLGVCEAYAKTYLYLCLKNNVNCVIVSGDGNGESHTWNLIEIDGEWYGVDCTWDDKEEFHYDNFGLSNSALNSKHVADNSSVYGVDYLYNLPTVSENGLELVDLYNGETFIGTYANIDSVFDAMTDEQGEYDLKLYKYSSSNVYKIKSSETPNVASFKLNGFTENLGGGFSRVMYVNVEEDLSVNSDMSFSYVSFNGNGSLNINSNTLTKMADTCYMDLPVYGSMDENNPSTIIGYIDYFNTLQVYNLYGGLMRRDSKVVNVYVFRKVYGYTLPSVWGSNVEIENLYGGLELKEGANVTVGNCYYQEGCGDNCEIKINVGSLEAQPMLRLGNCFNETKIIIDGKVSGVTGTEHWTRSVSPYDLLYPIVTLGKATDFEKLSINFSKLTSTDRTQLYGVTEEGKVQISSNMECVDGMYIKDGILFDYYGDSMEVVIPDSVTEIAMCAFSDSDIVSVKLPSNLVKIGQYAFYGTNIISIEIPSTVEEIASDAFNSCAKLVEIINRSPNFVFEIGSNRCYGANPLNVYNGSAEYLSKVSIVNDFVLFTDGEDVTLLEYRGSNSAINIPDGVTIVRASAFERNIVIKEVYVADSVNSIENSAFYFCTSLEKVVFGENSKLESIGSSAFSWCEKLNYINLPNGLKQVGGTPFGHCYNISHNIKDGLKYLGNNINPYLYLAGYERGITDAIIESGCKFIGSNALEDCTTLKKVYISNTVINISSFAFRDCNSLEIIIFEDNSSLEKIESYAFGYLELLTEIVIPSSVEYIGGDAFYSDYNLIIFTNVESAPSGWESRWNATNYGVYWLGEWEYVDGVPTPIV